MSERRTTAAALLAAGRHQFAELGYDGASVRSITREAGANLGGVTYHFGSKAALYRAVVSSSLDPLVAGLAEVAAQPGDPIDRVEWVARLCFDYLWENPDIARIMARELAREPPAIAAPAPLQRISDAVAAVIEQGQEEGSVRGGDGSLMAMSILAQVVQLALVRPRGATAPASAARDDEREQIEEHLVTFALGGVRRRK